MATPSYCRSIIATSAGLLGLAALGHIPMKRRKPPQPQLPWAVQVARNGSEVHRELTGPRVWLISHLMVWYPVTYAAYDNTIYRGCSISGWSIGDFNLVIGLHMTTWDDKHVCTWNGLNPSTKKEIVTTRMGPGEKKTHTTDDLRAVLFLPKVLHQPRMGCESTWGFKDWNLLTETWKMFEMTEL